MFNIPHFVTKGVKHKIQYNVNFKTILRRNNYVTPTSYLELLSSYRTLLVNKREEVFTMKNRLQIGLDKLSSTKEVVSSLKEEIEILAPQLVVTQKEVAELMEQITNSAWTVQHQL